jgi:glycosyltransferase involved in cell wall biosynthesis
MRRLLITACYAGSGGGEVALLRHLDHSTLDLSAITVALLNHGPLVDRIRERGVRCEVIGRTSRGGIFPGPRETWWLGWRVARLAAAARADAVLSYTVPDLRAALIARRLRSLHVFWRSQGELTIFAPTPGPAEQRLLRSVIRHRVRVIASTQWDAEALVRWGLAPEDVRSVPYGIDDAWFSPDDRRAGSTVPFRIAFSGRLERWKGQHVLIDALARLDALGLRDWEAWIIGGGDEDYRRQLTDRCRDTGLTNRVRFFGHVSTPRDLVSQCDVLVHASEREPFGLVIAEAMSLGVPVVASDTLGPREIVKPDQTGWLVSVGDASALASRLASLMQEPALRRAVAARARDDVWNRYRADRCIPELESLLFDPARWGNRHAPELVS